MQQQHMKKKARLLLNMSLLWYSVCIGFVLLILLYVITLTSFFHNVIMTIDKSQQQYHIHHPSYNHFTLQTNDSNKIVRKIKEHVNNRKNNLIKSITNDNNNVEQKQQEDVIQTYEYWKNLTIQLAQLSPKEIWDTLMNDDPYGVRTFEIELQKREIIKNASLDIDELKSIFPCPPITSRITIPDQRNHTKSYLFRQQILKAASSASSTTTSNQRRKMKQDQVLNNEGVNNNDGNNNNTNDDEWYFLFFQHLRKAGGTNFCTLAQKNLIKKNVGRYYCMDDWFWFHDNGDKAIGAGYLQHWTNDEITVRMKENRLRVIGNEWDNFDYERHIELPAILATSFRKPMDRALSQFRFECIEDRGCQIKDVGVWWEHRKDLYNIYTRTFATINQVNRSLINSYTSEYDTILRGQYISHALDTIIQFHLVLCMEWLAYSKKQVHDVLGFNNIETLQHRIRPHINQAKRDDGQENNNLGAAGIAKASWTPETYLSKEQYTKFQFYLSLDEILNDAARRIFLERIVCE